MSNARLIEEAFPLEAVSAHSSREKSARRGHISTLHIWWARRPLAMARAITLGLLVRAEEDESALKELTEFVARFSDFDRSLDATMVGRARELIRDAYSGSSPRVLDPFAGGGALPLEALRLGARVDALELNPVAYLLLLCTLDYPIRLRHMRSDGELAGRSALMTWVERGAQALRKIAHAEVGHFYAVPASRPHANAYLWARTLRCTNPNCGVEIPLLSSRWLDDRPGRQRALAIGVEGTQIVLTVVEGGEITGDANVGTVSRVTASCPRCRTTIDRAALRRIGTTRGYGERLVAVIEPGTRALNYRDPAPEDLEAIRAATQHLASLGVVDGSAPYPDETIPYSNLQVPYVYGFTSWDKYFNTRQKVLLAAFFHGVKVVHDEVLAEEGDPTLARAVATYLGLIVNRIADRNSTFSSWTAGWAKIRNTFARQGISNVWDYAETNPFGSGSGSWDQATEWVLRVIEHCEQVAEEPASVSQASAMHLPYEDATFDAVITDPPYYDSVQYGDLSDFFYVCLKRSVGFLYPLQFSTPQTPKAEEIVSKRLGRTRPGAVMAEEFERRLAVALAEVNRVLKPDGVATVIFAHTATAAWEALIRTLMSSNLVVTTSWPVKSEFTARSRAQGQPSLASSVCLVCRPRQLIEEGYFEDVRKALEDRVRTRLSRFWSGGLAGADLFISAIGPAIEVFGSYGKVVKLSGEPVTVAELLTLTQEIVADFTLTHLLDQSAVGVIDEISRFYLFWRWAYGTSAIPADDAYKLAQAFGAELDDLGGRHGLVAKVRDNVSLAGPRDRTLLATTPIHAGAPLIDVIHRACLLWEAGRRNDLAQLLADHGVDQDPAFWALAQALAELAPADSPEKMLAQGLTGSRASLSQDAALRRPTDQIALELS